MRRAVRSGVLALAAAGALALAAGTARADQVAELRATVKTQGELIERLQRELAELRQASKTHDDRMRALADELAAAKRGEGGGVDLKTVDRRIEAFQTSDESRLFLSGYGTAQFVDSDAGPSTFLASFNPIFHFRLTERVHFNAELELALTKVPIGGKEPGLGSSLAFAPETELGLEFAQIDFFATDWLTLSAGQFLLPFNAFGPRLHPTWVNRLASMPPIYSHEADEGGGIIPVLNDVGIMASGGTTLWSQESKINYAFYLTNGPETHELDQPELDFHTPDDNSNKAVGGRIGLLPIPNLEIGVSYQTGNTRGRAGRYNLLGADLWYRLQGLELRGEVIRLARDNGPSFPSVWGYYVQAAYRLGYGKPRAEGLAGVLARLEPVVRWGEINGFQPKNREQLAIGLNYWLFASMPLKFTYEFNDGAVAADRMIAQLAFGF